MLIYAILNSFFLVVGLKGITCSQYGHFWHVSDFHVDQNYSRTGNPNDLCHSENQKSFPNNGVYGNFLCDAPQLLINVTVSAMKKIHPQPDFIIWTGDSLPHTSVFDPDWDVTYEAIKNISSLLQSSFPDVPIIPCIGNHDTFPPNILPVQDPAKTIYKGYLQEGGWDKLIPKESWPTFIHGGYFSQLVKPKLRVISLNTILWYTPNILTRNISDPANQFKWMEQVLRNSSATSEKVYIIGHVAPGFYSLVVPGMKGGATYHPQHLVAANEILNKYSDIIIGQMYGHYHIDMFTISRYNTGCFKGSVFLASSVTPWHLATVPGNVSLPVNPSIRLMHFSLDSGALMDYDQFYLNLTKANANADNPEENKSELYKKLYSFIEFYNVPDLSTESLVRVYENLKSDPALYGSFFHFLSVGVDSLKCDSTCKVNQLCAMACTSQEEYNLCMRNVDSVHHITQRLARDITHVNPALIYGSAVLGVVIACLVGFILCKRFRKGNPRTQYQPFSHF